MLLLALHLAYHENGKPAGEWNYRDGRREGEAKEYDADGLLRYELAFEQDRLTRKKEFKAGKLVLDEEYLPDGSRK